MPALRQSPFATGPALTRSASRQLGRPVPPTAGAGGLRRGDVTLVNGHRISLRPGQLQQPPPAGLPDVDGLRRSTSASDAARGTASRSSVHSWCT